RRAAPACTVEGRRPEARAARIAQCRGGAGGRVASTVFARRPLRRGASSYRVPGRLRTVGRRRSGGEGHLGPPPSGQGGRYVSAAACVVARASGPARPQPARPETPCPETPCP